MTGKPERESRAAGFLMRGSRTSAGMLGMLVLLLSWECAARWVWRDPQVLPAPSQCLQAAWRHLTAGRAVALFQCGNNF